MFENFKNSKKIKKTLKNQKLKTLENEASNQKSSENILQTELKILKSTCLKISKSPKLLQRQLKTKNTKSHRRSLKLKKSPEIKLLSELKTSKISENPQKQKFLKIKKSQTKALNQTSLENQLQ